MSDASKRAQCCQSEKRLFHRKISKELRIIFKQGKYLSVSRPCVTSSRSCHVM
ncbi:hypothetical protein K788_0006805 [Paraburkholderia caribensis MBA4]|uniref:Uncharacterized protein n=1 Tax=Paraburkholderia caribensis MBA4 TaxID=1323664 RepID=A0A0P0R7L3_9BURK|nr:hypothetical protein K788_0006805 [Paraburkholderia caribensis MBA4]